MVIEDFKNFCRDQGKYNVTSLDELIKLFDEFEEYRKTRNYDSSSEDEQEDEININFMDLLNSMKNS